MQHTFYYAPYLENHIDVYSIPYSDVLFSSFFLMLNVSILVFFGEGNHIN
jgi:hypothetical protein